MSDINHPDHDIDDEITADTPARLKALGDPLRLRILDLVLERAMSVTELAERVDRPRGTVAHHVDVLVDAGLLRVVRTRKVRAVHERFYGRTARTIIVTGSGHPGRVPFLEQAMNEIDVDALEHDDSGSGFTYRHARIPASRAEEFRDRLFALAVEFTEAPRDGDAEYGLLAGVFPVDRDRASRAGSTEDES